MKNKKIMLFSLIVAFAIYFVGIDMIRVGKPVDMYQGIPIYHNGMFLDKVHGQNYSSDGYFYGLKWQCVEFVQRFYYDVLGHKMLDPKKDAKDYYDLKLGQGELNLVTGLKQFLNGNKMRPRVNDILVFHGGKYGHVAIISRAGSNFVEIVQQNVHGKPKERLSMITVDGKYTIKSDNKLVGWLRK